MMKTVDMNKFMVTNLSNELIITYDIDLVTVEQISKSHMLKPNLIIRHLARIYL